MRGGNTRHTRNVRCVHAEADALQHRAVPRRRALAGPLRGRHRPERREARRADGARVRDRPGVDDRARGPLAAAAHRHAAPRADQPLLPRRRQGADQHLLPDRRADGHRGRLRHDASRTWSTRRRPVPRRVVTGGGTMRSPRAVVCASGGFEANIDWLAPVLGRRRGQLHHPRPGTTTARCSRRSTRHGAAPGGRGAGLPRGRRRRPVARASTAASPPGSTRSRSASWSTPRGRRFYDEGEELWPKRYAIWGRNIAEQPGQIAYSIWDAKVRRLFLPPMYGPAEADSVGELAGALGLDPGAVTRDRRGVQRRGRPGGTFDPASSTTAAPRASARPRATGRSASTPRPTTAIAMRPGITFTYLGVTVDRAGPGRCARTARPFAQRLRGRGDHVRQRPVHRLPRRLRADHRQRLGPDRRSRQRGSRRCPRPG